MCSSVVPAPSPFCSFANTQALLFSKQGAVSYTHLDVYKRKLLHGLIGYEAQPAGMQIISYVMVLLAIAAGMYWAGSRKRREARQHTLADAH